MERGQYRWLNGPKSGPNGPTQSREARRVRSQTRGQANRGSYLPTHARTAPKSPPENKISPSEAAETISSASLVAVCRRAFLPLGTPGVGVTSQGGPAR
jgi:hypothetical protein